MGDMNFRCVMGGLIGAVVACLVPVNAASATQSDGNTVQRGATTYAGPGNSYQEMRWNLNTRRIKIKVKAASSLNTSTCIEGAVDWRTTSGHYDVRVVRVCRPGATEETDPGGDGRWQEPGNWDGRTVVGIRAATGSRISDSTLQQLGEIRAPQTPSGEIYGSSNGKSPSTSENKDHWSRVRTLYQDTSRGTVRSTRRRSAAMAKAISTLLFTTTAIKGKDQR